MSVDWPVVPVEQACDLIVDCVNKTAPVVPYATPYRMIRTTNIREGRISLESCRFVDEVTYEKWTRRAKLEYGDVLLTREAPIGEVGFVDSPDGLFLGQRVMQYRANVQVLHPRFLHYVFQSPSLQHQFGSHEGSGSVVSHIRVGDCSKFKIPLPPLDVQQGIAELLGALDDRISLLRETNATLEAIAQALFKSWFVDFDPVRAKAEGRQPQGMDAATAALFPDSFEASGLGSLPKGWAFKPIGELVEGIYDGPHATPTKSAEGPIFLGIKNLTGTSLDLSDVRHISESDWSQWTRRIEPRHGDIVFSYEATLGFFAVIPPSIRCCLGRRLALVRPHEENGAGLFWFHQFVSAPFQQLLVKHTMRIPRHSDTQPTLIRTPVPRSFGQAVGAQRR
ncbi:MAG TPA: hypothetical protein DEH10_05630, partial [Pseudomonas sp.]|nr:hypothetical protein [Pseudomonas sp.]